MTAPTLPPVEDHPAPEPEGRRGLGAFGAAAASRARRAGARVGRVGPGARSPWLLGPLAALWAAGIGLAIAAIPLLVVWMATPASGLTWTESLDVAGLLWAVAHGTPIAIGGVTYSLLPWGLALIPLVLMAYAGSWAARSLRSHEGRSLVVLVLSSAVVYAAIVGVIAQIAGRSDARVSPLDAVIHALVLALAGFGFGAVRGARLDIGRLVPSWLSITVRGGLIATATLLGAGAVAATVALIVRVDDAVTMTQSLQTGIWGGLGLLLLGVAYAPVLIVWATSYVVGAGVMIGPAVAVSPFIPVTAPTQLPPFPLLAALPQSASPLAWALPLAGVCAGVVAGLAIARRARADSRLLRLAMALGAAAVAAVSMLVLAYLATGGLGDLRLASLGPPPATVAVLVFVLVTLGAVPSAVVTSPPAKPRLAVAEPTTVDAAEGVTDDV